MKIAQLVLEYVTVLAWPVVAVAALLVFRSDIKTLLSRVKKASGFGAEIELEAEARRVAAQAEQLPELPPHRMPKPDKTGVGLDRPVSSLEGQTTRLGELIVAWLSVEGAARSLSERLGLPPSAGPNLRRLSSELVRRDLLSTQARDVAVQLQEVRNRVIHEPDGVLLTESFISDFKDAARNLVTVLEGILPTPSPSQ